MDSISSQPCILQPHESSSLTKMNSDKSLTQEPQQIETKQLSPNFPRRNRVPFEYVSILPPSLEDADSNDLIVELSPKSLESKSAYKKILSSVSKCLDEYRSVNLTFELLGIEKVNNPSLSQRFARCQQYLSDRGSSTHVLTWKQQWSNMHLDIVANQACLNMVTPCTLAWTTLNFKNTCEMAVFLQGSRVIQQSTEPALPWWHATSMHLSSDNNMWPHSSTDSDVGYTTRN